MITKRFILMLLVMLMSVTGTFAQMSFIKEVKVSGRSTDDNYNDLISEGYTVVKQSDGNYFDFNGGETGGDYVYIGYKTTTDPREAISDLAIIYNQYNINPNFGTDDFLYGGSKTMMIGNKRYYLAPHDGGPDMNNGNTKKHVNSVYLYYTRDVDVTDGTKILTKIEGRSWGSEQTTVPDGWDSMIHGYQDYEYYGTNGYRMLFDEQKIPFGDTNYGGGGNYRYILCNYADVHYVDTDGQVKLPGAFTYITNESSTLNSGWYIVQGNNVQTGTLTCHGDVKLILADDAKLTATGQANNPGIQVSATGASLTIYGQKGQSGKLIATILLDKQGGIGGSESTTATYHAAMPKITVPTRTGYTFSGYYTEPNGGGIKYYNVDGTNAHAWDNASNTTLYAHWIPNNYTVTLDMQGGGEGTASVTATYDDAMPEITIPTREDYAFSGYFSQPNGRGTKYYNADGTSAHVWNVANNTTTLYAQWKLVRPHYIDADGSKKFITEFTEITNASSTTTLSSGWYIVYEANVCTTTLVCEGAVHLILMDGAILTATGDRYDAGIRVSAEGASLTIYGQQNQTGQLIAIGGYNGSGIGGGDNGAGHNITINGGIITTTGGYRSAGIGGGCMSFGENITINRGVVTATGGEYGEGIGGDGYGRGYGSSNIFVNSSLVLYADGNNPPATIIRHATDTDVSSSLLDKQYAIVRIPVKGITITFDKQDGTGGDDQTTANENEEMPQIQVPTRNGYAFQGYYAGQNGTGVKYYNADGTSAYLWDHTESATLYANWKVAVSYIDADGTEKEVGVFEEITNSTTTLAEGWYIVRGADVQTRTLVCEGAVHLILMDGAKLTATGGDYDAGIRVSAEGASLTIYGQTNQTGQLIANGDIYASGIGGSMYRKGHDITINGGIITATGGWHGAGIGGGEDCSGENITINRGIVTASSGGRASGIGDGGRGGSSNIFVNSSLVLYADGNNPPATIIRHATDEEVSGLLSGKQYAIVRIPVKGITITFDKQDGTGGDDQTTANENEDMPQINVPTRNGYAFQGYYAEPNGTGVKYYNADGTSAYLWDHTESATLYAHWKVPVSYIDADGTEKEVGVFEEITNSTTTLAEGWYIVRGADVQTHTLVCEGAVHLILMDGAKLTATGGDYDAGIRVSAEGASLTIYGQKDQNGQLIATGDCYGAGIGGGNWGTGHDITINGGVITAVGGTDASAIGAGDGGSSSNIHINAALFLKADENATPTTEIEHTSTVDLASALSGKQYATLTLPSVNVNKVPEQDVNYGTFYHKYADYTVPNEDATIYTASVEDVQGETCLVLHKLESNVIPANTAVILRTDESSVIDLLPCADASDITVPANSLSGANLPMDAPANCYIMSYGQNGLGFYKYSQGKTLSAHKAYLTYQQPAGAPALRMVFEDAATGIAPLPTSPEGEEMIYNLQGIRLDKLQKGINIVNGKKVVIK